MIISDRSKNKILNSNVLELAQNAKRAKLEDRETINATIGMLSDEAGSLYSFKAVEKAEALVSLDEKYGYGTIAGSPDYAKAIEEWVFGPFLADVKANKYLDTVATPGGSGALALIFSNYVEENQVVLFPHLMWENYLVYAYENKFIGEAYKLFDGDKFNMKGLKERIDSLKKEQKRIVLLINDPCENPTGFCMEDQDYDNLIQLAKDNPANDFVFIVDMAYFDFYNSDYEVIRKRYQKLANAPDNALVFFCFSGSKTFGLYGLRIGALLCLAPNEEEKKLFHNASCFSARGHWSSASSLGMAIIKKIILDETLNQQFKQEIKDVCQMLEKRSLAFLAGAKEVGLETYPYERGFFVSIPTKNAEKLMTSLYQDKVRVVVSNGAIRVALCGISEEEARRLPKLIKNRMTRENL